jgi:hypothetical protein
MDNDLTVKFCEYLNDLAVEYPQMTRSMMHTLHMIDTPKDHVHLEMVQAANSAAVNAIGLINGFMRFVGQDRIQVIDIDGSSVRFIPREDTDEKVQTS